MSKASEARALALIDDADSMTQQDLATALGLDRARASRLVTSLVRKGELAREQDPANRSRNILRRPTPGASAVPEPSGGAWIAYCPDYSGANVFGDELSALRFAVEHSMSVKFVEYGGSIR